MLTLLFHLRHHHGQSVCYGERRITADQLQSNFLPLPYKRAGPIPDLGPRLLSYITTHFRDAHPEAFRRDVDQFVALRREWVESKGEAHPEGVKGLMRYHAQLAFLVTKFPSDVSCCILGACAERKLTRLDWCAVRISSPLPTPLFTHA